MQYSNLGLIVGPLHFTYKFFGDLPLSRQELVPAPDGNWLDRVPFRCLGKLQSKR